MIKTGLEEHLPSEKNLENIKDLSSYPEEAVQPIEEVEKMEEEYKMAKNEFNKADSKGDQKKKRLMAEKIKQIKSYLLKNKNRE
jgi:hypothetical protein